MLPLYDTSGWTEQWATVPVLLFHPERSASPWKDVERLAGQVVGMP